MGFIHVCAVDSRTGSVKLNTTITPTTAPPVEEKGGPENEGTQHSATAAQQNEEQASKKKYEQEQKQAALPPVPSESSDAGSIEPPQKAVHQSKPVSRTMVLVEGVLGELVVVFLVPNTPTIPISSTGNVFTQTTVWCDQVDRVWVYKTYGRECRYLDGRTVSCPGCGPFSETVYCGKDCMLADAPGHFKRCGMFLPDRRSQLGSLPDYMSDRPPLIPSVEGVSNPARHRQAMWFCTGRN